MESELISVDKVEPIDPYSNNRNGSVNQKKSPNPDTEIKKAQPKDFKRIDLKTSSLSVTRFSNIKLYSSILPLSVRYEFKIGSPVAINPFLLTIYGRFVKFEAKATIKEEEVLDMEDNQNKHMALLKESFQEYLSKIKQKK
ncbi:MAG: hypothetical protein H0W88_12130 [Parachlamydiaceae bacterium]|nr:hypothetical protein [Parachlamydiaceae bacterium]